MEMIKLVVTKVVSEPVFKLIWCVDVAAEVHGVPSAKRDITLTFLTQSNAERVCVGYEFWRMNSEIYKKKEK